jgi:hypothetical protein
MFRLASDDFDSLRTRLNVSDPCEATVKFVPSVVEHEPVADDSRGALEGARFGRNGREESDGSSSSVPLRKKDGGRVTRHRLTRDHVSFRRLRVHHTTPDTAKHFAHAPTGRRISGSVLVNSHILDPSADR